jgi:type III pantothenate kinase
MRYKALNTFTGKLPLLSAEIPKNPEGNSTIDSIQSGVYFGVLDEIKGRIEYYREEFGALTVILTGGDANKLPKTLKNTIFAHPNFLAVGMLHLLKLNLD